MEKKHLWVRIQETLSRDVAYLDHGYVPIFQNESGWHFSDGAYSLFSRVMDLTPDWMSLPEDAPLPGMLEFEEKLFLNASRLLNDEKVTIHILGDIRLLLSKAYCNRNGEPLEEGEEDIL